MRNWVCCISLVVLLALPGTALAVAIPGIIGYADVSMHDCLGPNDAAETETYDYEYIAGGERIRIKITVDDDDDEVQTCDLLVTADGGGGNVFTIYDSTTDSVYDEAQSQYVAAGNGVWGQGEHKFQVRLSSNLGGKPAGGYYVKIKATVVTPVGEAGENETESDYVVLYKKKRWNLLVYVAGDNSLSAEAVDDLEEMDDDGTTEFVNILALTDVEDDGDGQESSGGATHLQGLVRIHYNWDADEQGYWMRDKYGLQQNNGTYPSAIGAAGSAERDSGNSADVEKFFDWAHDVHPADDPALILWDHGAGWFREFCEDDTSGSGMLPKEFEEGVLGDIETENGGDLEILGFDACLMGSAEIAYQFRNHVQYFIGSEELEGGGGWDWEDVCEEITDHSTRTPAQYADAIVDQGAASASVKTLSATRLSVGTKKIADLRTEVEALATLLMADSYEFPCHVIRAREDTEYAYKQHWEYADYSYIDLYDYCKTLREKLDGVDGSAAIRAKAQDVMDLISPCGAGTAVLENYNIGGDYADFKGLTVSYSMLTFRADNVRAGNSTTLHLTYYPCPTDATSDANNKHTHALENVQIQVYLDYYYSDANRKTDWAADGANKSEWMNWIEYDIVPPRIKKLKIADFESPFTERYLYERTSYKKAEDDATRNDDDKSKASGWVTVEITFDEKMDDTVDPKVEGLTRAVVAAPGWDVADTKWTGKVCVDCNDYGLNDITVSEAEDEADNVMDKDLTNLVEAEADDTHKLDVENDCMACDPSFVQVDRRNLAALMLMRLRQDAH